ncbi:MAG: hypothetical protein R6X12_10050 [bacterium]
MLYFGRKDLANFLYPDRIFFGEGRGEFGICLHLPLKNHMAGSAPMEDYLVMLGVANNLVEFVTQLRQVKGPELWDYDVEKASEHFEVCGDNPNSSGIILYDKNYSAGPKIQIFLDKTFGSNEVSIRWKNQMIGDDKLLGDYERYLKEALRGDSLSGDRD